MKFWFLALLVLCVACENVADAPPRPTPLPEAQAVPWQRPNQIITAENIRQAELLGVLDGHTDSVFEVAFSANGQRMATMGGDERLILWNMANGQSLMSIGDQVTSQAFLPADNSSLLTLNADNQLQKWVILEGTSQSVGLESRVSVARLDPESEYLAIGTLDGQISLWESENFAQIRQIEAHPINGVQNIFFSADGSRAITLGREGVLSFWDTQNWRKIQDLAQDSEQPLAISVSPDLTRLAIAYEENLTVYNLSTGAVMSNFTIPPYRIIRQMVFSADNIWLAIGGDLDSVTIFEVADGDLVVALREHGRNFLEMGFSPDRSLILTSLDGGQVLAWNLTDLIDRPLPENQLEIQIPRAQLNLVENLRLNRLLWSPQSNYLVLADQNGLVYIIGLP